MNPTDTHTALSSEQLDRLATLHTRIVDARAGFRTMVEKSDPGFRGVAARFRDLHDQHAAELAALLEVNGRRADRDGSFMATINTLVVSARALFDGIDEDAMNQIRDGEKHVLDAMDDALAAVPAAPAGTAVARMKGELMALLDETANLD